MPLCVGGLRLVVMIVSVPLLLVGFVLAAEQAIDWGFFATLHLLALFLFDHRLHFLATIWPTLLGDARHRVGSSPSSLSATACRGGHPTSPEEDSRHS